MRILKKGLWNIYDYINDKWYWGEGFWGDRRHAQGYLEGDALQLSRMVMHGSSDRNLKIMEG